MWEKILRSRHSHALCSVWTQVRALHVTNAFHSPALQPAADKVSHFVDVLGDADKPARGEVPVASNVTGAWMNEEEVKKGECVTHTFACLFLPLSTTVFLLLPTLLGRGYLVL